MLSSRFPAQSFEPPSTWIVPPVIHLEAARCKAKFPPLIWPSGTASTNSSPILKLFLSRLGELISHARPH